MLQSAVPLLRLVCSAGFAMYRTVCIAHAPIGRDGAGHPAALQSSSPALRNFREARRSAPHQPFGHTPLRESWLPALRVFSVHLCLRACGTAFLKYLDYEIVVEVFLGIRQEAALARRCCFRQAVQEMKMIGEIPASLVEELRTLGSA